MPHSAPFLQTSLQLECQTMKWEREYEDDFREYGGGEVKQVWNGNYQCGNYRVYNYPDESTGDILWWMEYRGCDIASYKTLKAAKAAAENHRASRLKNGH